MNKATVADTASLLFQTGFPGRAEIGLAGDENLSFKVSADGMAWSTAMSINAGSGDVSIDRLNAAGLDGTAVQSNPADTTPGRLMRADWGYGPGNVVGQVAEQAGTPTGAVIESGSNANGSYVRFADGTQICTIPKLTLYRAARHNMRETWIYPAAFAEGSTPTVTHTAGMTSATGYAASSGERIYWGVASTYILNDRALIDLYRTNGAPNIPEGATISTACQAIGRWF